MTAEFRVLRTWRDHGQFLRVSVPWGMVAPHERQARTNHGGQSLERLNERGGLDPTELVAVLEDRPWVHLTPVQAEAALEKQVAAYLQKQKEEEKP